jgi:hypothetical protein
MDSGDIFCVTLSASVTAALRTSARASWGTTRPRAPSPCRVSPSRAAGEVEDEGGRRGGRVAARTGGKLEAETEARPTTRGGGTRSGRGGNAGAAARVTVMALLASRSTTWCRGARRRWTRLRPRTRRGLGLDGRDGPPLLAQSCREPPLLLQRRRHVVADSPWPSTSAPTPSWPTRCGASPSRPPSPPPPPPRLSAPSATRRRRGCRQSPLAPLQDPPFLSWPSSRALPERIAAECGAGLAPLVATALATD